ncbi:mediator of RNA polymerase II transcription subunit 15a-like isoform X1 [Salvia splendens]|uniref:mediator of RNA polymerase II transcription subunit 15a-like isoform X1 n=1 Tax=Salvia splendens TaxID=180675 RepID=UPI001C2610BC|nr:mediator of RNA polymerase II transcription subunit 15a-like isoform X1 [Salvia splendens]
MDEIIPKSDGFEEWVKELLPDATPEIGSMWQQQEHTSVKAERPSTSQLSVDSQACPRILNQQPQLMQHSSAGFNSTHLMEKSEQEPLHKFLEPKSGMVLERAHSRLQMPSLYMPQNLTMAMPDQLKPQNQTPLGALHASESTSQVDMEWVNSAYQKIMQLKDMYLSQFLMLHHKMQELKRQATDAEMVNKWEKNRCVIERKIRLLNISKSDLLHMKRERITQMLNEVMRYVSQLQPRNPLYSKQTHHVEASGNHMEAPQIQQRENQLHFNSLHQSLIRPGGTPCLPQSSLSSLNAGSSAGVHKVDASSNVNSYQYNLIRPMQPWAPQGSVAPSARKGASQAAFDARALRMLLHPSSGVSQYNNLGASQHQPVTSTRNIFNSLDYSVSPMAQVPLTMPPLQNNQQDQAMKRQKMKQPLQQLMNEKNKPQMLQKRNEDTKLRRFVGFNQKWSSVLPPSSSPYAMSPQNSQQSSPQFEIKELSAKFSKSATPSLSSASPSALPSPLTPMTPLTPSSVPADCVMSPLLEESSKLAKNPVAASQPPLQDTNCNQPVTDTQRSTKSCLHRESLSSGAKQPLKAKGDPLKRLIEVVKSVSSKALNATVRDINAVTTLTDRVAGNFVLGKAKKIIFYDLADDIVSCCDEGDMKSGMKRELDALASDDFRTETELYAMGSVKRLKTETNYQLLEEIKEINKKLIEVVVDVMIPEGVSRLRSDEGTLIRCSYIPVGFSGNMKISNTSKFMFPTLLLDLLVSADYPNSSPSVLEKDPSGSCDGEEGRYMWTKAKANLILSLRNLPQPMSVKDVAEAWHLCAREVFHELADHAGGGSFSSTYGKWESCAVAV